MSKERETQLVIILGYNGTGKTTLVKKMIAHALQQHRRVLIVTPDDIEFQSIPLVHSRFQYHLQTYKGARRLIFEDKSTLEIITRYFDNGLLIFDDCRAYLESTTSKELHQLLIRRRQKMLDIVAVGHGFTEVPPKFFTFASSIILFQTKDNIERRKNVLKDYERMVNAQKKVNEFAKDNPHTYTVIPQ